MAGPSNNNFNDFFNQDLGANSLPEAPAPNEGASLLPPSLPGQGAHPMASHNNIVDALDYMRNNHQGVVQNPYQLSKEVMFGAQREHHNFERYYNKSNFEELGFSPFRNNEALYNENSSFWDEMSTAAGQWGTLFGLGMKDAFGFGDLTDRENAWAFERAMNIGSSSKEGFGGFTTNLFLNSGYSVGIMAELALEEVGLALGSLALGIPSGGSSLVAGGAAMAARGARAGNKLYKAWNTGKNLVKSLDKLKDINKAREYFTKATKSAGRFLNPLENTMDFARVTSKTDDFKNLGKLAKSYTGVAAFYRDVRNVRLAFGESALEGGMVQNQMEDDLLKAHYEKYDRPPTAEEAQSIRANAKQAGTSTSWMNMPTIFFSNKIVFDNMFKGFNPARRITLDVLEKNAAGKIMFNKAAGATGKGAFEVVENNAKGFLKTMKNPRAYASVGMNYFKANLAEGLQETAQEVISGANVDYYTNQWAGTPLKGGMWSAMADNVQKQFSGTGFETFMSGFLMGGMLQPVQKGPSYIKSAYTKFKDPAGYEAAKAERVDYMNKTVNNLNEMLEDPLKYFSHDTENLQNQEDYNHGIRKASKEGDKKSHKDLKDASFYDHVYTALRTGRMDTFLERLQDMSQLSEEEVQQEYGMSKEQFDMKLNKSIDRANNIQARYNLVENKYGNPFNPNAYERGSEEYTNAALGYRAYQMAQKEMIFNGESFDRSLQRMNDILGSVKDDSKLSNTPTLDITNLFNVADTESELSLLNEEIKSYGEPTTAQAKKELRYKKKKRDLLQKFAETIDEVLSDTAEVEDTDSSKKKGSQMSTDFDGASKQVKFNKAYKSFEKYLTHVAKQNGDFAFKENLETVFNKLVDHYQLNDEAQRFADAVNTMTNPNSVYQRASRIQELLQKLHENKKTEIQKSLEGWLDVYHKNTLLQLLYDEDIFLEPADIAAVNEGKLPKKLYEMGSRPDGTMGVEKEIKPGTDKWEKTMNMIKTFMEGVMDKEVTEPVSSEEVVDPVVEEGVKVTSSTPMSEIKKDHPALYQELLQAFKETNRQREAEGYDPYAPGWQEMSDEELGKNRAFRNMFKTFKPARAAISTYNKKNNLTAEPKPKKKKKAPVKSVAKPKVEATEVSDEEFSAFVDKGEVSPERIESIAEKVRTRSSELSEREQAIYADKVAEVNKIIEQKFTAETRWTPQLRREFLKLGYNEKEIREFTPQEASIIVQDGLSKTERAELETLAEQTRIAEEQEQGQKVMNELQDLVDSANNLEELDIAKEFAFDIFSDPQMKKLTGITAEIVEEMINKKEVVLAPEDEVSSEEKDLSNKSVENIQDINDPEAIKQDIEAGKNASDADLDADLLDTVNDCK